MRLVAVALLLQAGLLTAPDSAQMEKAPDLGFAPVAAAVTLPEGARMGAPSSVALTPQGRLIVFARADKPLLEFDRDGKFVRAFGEGLYMRPHGMRVDAEGNIWTTDVNAHTVRKMNPSGELMLTIGADVVNQPTDIAFGTGGEFYVTQGHGQSDPKVFKFDRAGKLLTSWGGKGSGPGQFDVAHSIVVDGKGLVYVADRQNRRVQIFDGSGRFVREWKFAGLPCGLYLAPDGQMYLVSGFAGQILRLDANGRAVAATGQPGKGLGEFGEAHYLTFGPQGEIFVADTVNAVLHKFVARSAQAPATAQAPPPQPTMYNVTYVDIMPSGGKQMVAAFTQYREASRKENGFVSFELFEMAGVPGHYVVLETWRDQAAFDAHNNAPHVKTYRDALQSIRVSGYDQRPYKVLTVGPGKPAGGNVHVVTHVDFAGANATAQAPGFLTEIANQSRKDRGNVRFDVLQSSTRPNHFTVVESWQTQADFDAHAAAAHTRTYRDALTPITGSPLDENVYRRVE